MSVSIGSHVRASLSAVVIAGSVLLSACLRSTAPLPSQLNLSGTWSYTGVQTGPVRENLLGTLTISRESGTSFQGRVDLRGTNAQTGEVRLLGGLMSGSASGTNIIDFEADIEATPRRHFGQIVADTITGTWVGTSADGSTPSGTFRVVRESR